MYYRLYPSKNNTIFQQFSPGTNTPLPWSQLVNTGASPIMQLMDGSGQSSVILGFEFPTWLIDKLNEYSYTCNLKMFDAGTEFNSPLPLKDIQVEFFNSDFTEGNGWFFDQSNATNGVSNWLNNKANSLWSSVSFSSPVSYSLNKNNEDILFDVTPLVSTNINSPGGIFDFAISVTDPELDQNILAKFLYGKYTKTMFQPYIEFFIDDEILDSAYNFIAGQSNSIYFINENGVAFTDTVTASVLLNDGSTTIVTSANPSIGVYYINVTPIEPKSFAKKEYVTVTWLIGTTAVYKQILEVTPQNLFVSDISFRNLMFYPTTPYTHNIVRHGDIIPFEVVSQIRGQGDIITNTYQYRIVNQSGFEMVPWTPVSVYRNKMFFYIRTDYFYPDMQYEVFIQNVQSNFQMTSNTTYSFKLTTNEESHLRTMSASPYYNRSNFFGK